MNIIRTTNIDYTPDMTILSGPSIVIDLFTEINAIENFTIRKKFEVTQEHWNKRTLELLNYEKANFEYAVVMYINFFSRWNRVINVFKLVIVKPVDVSTPLKYAKFLLLSLVILIIVVNISLDVSLCNESI